MVLSGHLVARNFFSGINASSYDAIVKYTTFGRDSAWKNQIILPINKNHKSVLDLACGTGIMSSFISNKTGGIIVGADLTLEYIVHAKKRNYSSLVNSVAEFLPFKSESFDILLSSYLVKYANLPGIIQEHKRILKKGGIAIFHDFTYPKNSLMKKLWNNYFKILNQFGKVVPSWKIVFSNLDKIIRNSEWVENILVELKDAGFESINTRYYTLGTAAIIKAIKS